MLLKRSINKIILLSGKKMNVQDDSVSLTLKSWESQETLCFENVDEIELDSEFICTVCHLASAEVLEKLHNQWLEYNCCLLLVDYIVYL